MILSTGFENGLALGDLGFDTINNQTAVTQDSTTSVHGSYSARVVGSTTTKTSLEKNTSTQTLVGATYFRVSAIASSGGTQIIKASGTSDLSIQIKTNGTLQGRIGSTLGSGTTTVISPDTWYLVDWKFDASGSTFTVDFALSDSAGTLIETGTQTTKSSTAETLGPFELGDMQKRGVTLWYDDARLSTTLADYPLGAGTGDDTPTVIAVTGNSWIDNPSLIRGGILYGCHGHGDTLPADPENPADFQAMESSSVGNRTSYFTHTFYTDATYAPFNLAVERSLINGSLLSHRCDPILNILGFGSTTTNWPARGLAAFADGTMDATLQAHCDIINRDLPQNTPVLIRLWREMNGGATIYGSSGASNGGVNESPESFAAAWEYVTAYLSNQCNVRFIFCFGSGSASNSLSHYSGWLEALDLSTVDWIACDGYVKQQSDLSYPHVNQVFAVPYPYMAGFGLPIMICETQVSSSDPDRITHLGEYAGFADDYPLIQAVCFWDSAGDENRVNDTPTGFLSAYQSVISASPFLGAPSDVGYVPLVWRGPEGIPDLRAEPGSIVIASDGVMYRKESGNEEIGWVKM